MKFYFNIDDKSVNSEDDITSELKQQLALFQAHRIKYRIMWELRELEKEINNDGGIFIYQNGKLETKNFTEEITESINTRLSSIDWSVW